MILAAIIPALNEEKAIGKVVVGALQNGVDLVVVVDNGSTDSTAEIAASSGAKVVQELERGYGAACLRGMEELRPQLQGGDVMLFMDGDAADDPMQIRELIDPILQDEADMVIGSRSLGNADRGSITPQQRCGNWLASRLLKVIYGLKATDLGPFRAVRADVLYGLGMSDRNFGWTIEMQIRAAKQGLRVVELPVNYRKRIGESKVSGTFKGSVLAGYKIIYTLMRYA